MSDARTEYLARQARWQREAERLERTDGWLASGRMASFFAGAALVWWVLASAPSAWLAPAAAFVTFAALVGQHGRVRVRLERARRAQALYARNLARLDDRWSGTGPTGVEFLRDEHLYARDLDLFGEGSLFQLLCSVRTKLGERTLAAWLCASPEQPGASEIRARQQAVLELAPDVELRERLALLGEVLHDDLDAAQLLAWTRAAPRPAPAWERPAALLLAALAVATAAAWVVLGMVGPLGVVVLLEAAFGLAVKRRQAREQHDLQAVGPQLTLLSELLAVLERRPARAERLSGLAAALEAQGAPPSQQLARIEHLVQALENSRLNAVYGVLAFLLQLRVHWLAGVESWRQRVGPSIAAWLDAAGEFEALCALGAYAYEHPGHAVPEIVEGPARFVGEQLGHPLIPAGRCVRNDLALDGPLQLVLVTGSNMSGKSTMLRTVGTQAVLAMAGAPVPARRLSLSPCVIGASIQVHDSLAEGTSRFYAEISRLRAILQLAQGGRPLLFLLDEILHGTNSHDRRAGSEAVVRSLVARGAVGLVTTHDLALTEIAAELGPRARNAHFSDELVEGRMRFDYRMHEGIVRRGNALELMRSMGLDV